MTPLDRAASLVHDATCRDNQHDGPESEYPCVELARAVVEAQTPTPHTITTVEELRALNGDTVLRSLKDHGAFMEPSVMTARHYLTWRKSVLDLHPDAPWPDEFFPATVLTAQSAISTDPNDQSLGQIDAERLFAVLAHYDSDLERAHKSIMGPSIAILAGADLANGIRDILKDAGLTVAGESDG